MSQFAVKILKKEANPLSVCTFTDIANRSQEMKYYIDLSCRLGIMGLKSD